MNANELADKLEDVGMEQKHYDTIQQAATMLRQQQAEIEALKYEKSSGVYDPEPVAWIDEINTFVLNKDYKQFPKNLQNGMIPLYTHPAKTLTDEEMEIIAETLLMIGFKDDFINYALKEKAQAILKKAQEK